MKSGGAFSAMIFLLFFVATVGYGAFTWFNPTLLHFAVTVTMGIISCVTGFRWVFKHGGGPL